MLLKIYKFYKLRMKYRLNKYFFLESTLISIKINYSLWHQVMLSSILFNFYLKYISLLNKWNIQDISFSYIFIRTFIRTYIYYIILIIKYHSFLIGYTYLRPISSSFHHFIYTIKKIINYQAKVKFLNYIDRCDLR